MSVQFLGWGNSALLTPCQQLVGLLSRALSDGPNVYLKRNPVCYVKNNPLSVDFNGSEMSINKEIFKVALAVSPERVRPSTDFSKASFSNPSDMRN